MSAESRVGIFFCRSGDEAEPSIDLEAVAAYARDLPGVAHVRVLAPGEPSRSGLADEIRRDRLGAVVVAGSEPGRFKPAVTRAMADAGADPEQVRLASFRGRDGAVDGATERAKAVVLCAVVGVPFALAAEPKRVPVHAETLVIGGGVAGIQATLEIADAGHKVFLVERQGTIGGHMAMFDKTFPTLDCAACILTPKMVAIGQHPNVELMVLSEVTEVSGRAGDYRVKVLRHATRVDAQTCVACNDCAQFCPVVVPSEFDVGIGTRKAIFIPFPQAVPNAYMVDPATCTWVISDGKKCGACLKKCAKGAIHLDARDETVELHVGNIVVATGYDTFDARRIERYGYGTNPNVLTSLEFERLTNASGPTGGRIVLKAKRHNKRTKTDEWVFDGDGPKPRSVAIIHCVGSRDENFNPHCSRVCCMYSLKFAHLVREKLPDARCTEYFIDMRAFGKGYEEFFERIKDEGVRVVRGRTAKVFVRDGQTFVKGEDVVAGRVVEEPTDMVLLSVGLEPTADTAGLAKTLGIARGADGWLEELDSNAEPSSTARGGIFVAGVCQGPKDIPDTVAQASAAAAKVLRSIVSGGEPEGRRHVTLREVEESARALASGWGRGEAT